jgi:hypothetical protein
LPGLPEPFDDPVRGSVCGLQAHTALGSFGYLPAPRRAAGPNLMALCVGAGDAIARLGSASLALVKREARHQSRRAAAPTPLSEGEAEAWSTLVAAFRRS